MKALLVIVIALLLLVGAITAVIAFSPSGPTVSGSDQVLGNAVLGKQVSMRVGCATCHSEDGTIMIGPSFKGLWGSVQTYEDGSSGLIDDAEVRAALREPNAKVMRGFEPRMTEGLDKGLTEDDWMNLLAYLRSLGVKH